MTDVLDALEKSRNTWEMLAAKADKNDPLYWIFQLGIHIIRCEASCFTIEQRLNELEVPK